MLPGVNVCEPPGTALRGRLNHPIAGSAGIRTFYHPLARASSTLRTRPRHRPFRTSQLAESPRAYTVSHTGPGNKDGLHDPSLRLFA